MEMLTHEIHAKRFVATADAMARVSRGLIKSLISVMMATRDRAMAAASSAKLRKVGHALVEAPVDLIPAKRYAGMGGASMEEIGLSAMMVTKLTGMAVAALAG